MILFKVTLYVLTLGTAFFFGYMEVKLKARINKNFHESSNPADYGSLNTIKKRAGKSQLMNSQPPSIRNRYRSFIALKVGFLVLFVIELAILQR